MFNVRDRVSGRIFTVYAVLGCRFLLWNEVEEFWFTEDIDKFVPAKEVANDA